MRRPELIDSDHFKESLQLRMDEIQKKNLENLFSTEVLLYSDDLIDESTGSPDLEERYPSDLLCLFKAKKQRVADDFPNDKPPWYDHEKYTRGQQFANDYYASVNYAEMLTLLILFSFSGNMKPLIYTARSETTKKAGKRYSSTALRVLSWYEEDIWDTKSAAFRNIQLVRALHKNTEKRMNNHSKQEMEQRSTLKNLLQPSEIKCISLPSLQEDFSSGVCPFWVHEMSKSDVLINQAEMSFTLFGFMGLIVLYPEKLGIIGASNQDLEGFVHLWRVLGYLLGIEDQYNICQGTYEQVKQRCQHIVDWVFLPNLALLTEEWEHMSRCMIEGVAMTIPGPTFETSLLQLFWMTGGQATKFRRQLKWKYVWKHYINRFLMSFIMRFEFMRLRFNKWVKKQMRLKALTLLNDNRLVEDR